MLSALDAMTKSKCTTVDDWYRIFADRQMFSENSGVPVDALQYSDFISGERWTEVDEVLRGVYKEAGEALGREFPYPGDQ